MTVCSGDVNEDETLHGRWLEGLALLGLYVIIAASVWYGPPIHP